MARGRGERSLMPGVFESVEKTTPASGFFYLPYMTNGLSRREGLLEDDIVGTRDPGDPDLDNPVCDGDITIPIDVDATGFWLKALLGDPTTSEVTGVYTHVFESGAWTLPSMSLERQVPDVPSFEMFSGARANRLQIEMQRGGRLNGTVGVIAQGAATPAGSTAAGTPTSFGELPSRFMQREGVVKIGGSTVANVVGLSFEYNNNLDPVETITADGFIGGLDPMRAACSGTMRLRFDSETLFAAAKAGTGQTISLEWTKSASASLVLALGRVKLSVPGRPIDGPGGIEAEFQWMAGREANGDPMLTATLVNEVDAY
ncbi:phage tail tube protein [Sagittula sp. MA-2]|uniref:phage tail tube protein n=1 Tax=Sagittula sp. MA-2 TaxID=3048007 RepID=UPI0024C2ED36|nr:phage tail tube protein [Sagittula sp. MA-2]WHZ33410.1 phage tail tube protein [Sagittula sp. MA-2]